MENIRRPKSVSLISGLIIFESVLILMIVFRSSLDTDKTIGFTFVWAAFYGLLGIVTGIAIFKGFNWGRLLFLWVTPAIFVVHIVIFGFNPWYIAYGVGYIIMLLFLMQPDSLKYFGLGESEQLQLKT